MFLGGSAATATTVAMGTPLMCWFFEGCRRLFKRPTIVDLGANRVTDEQIKRAMEEMLEALIYAIPVDFPDNIHLFTCQNTAKQTPGIATPGVYEF